MVHDHNGPLSGRTCLYPFRTAVDLAPPPGHDGGPGAPAEPPPAGTGIEIAVIDDDGVPADLPSRRATIEVWTRNRIYFLDAALSCLEVTCRDTGASDPSPRCRGARLVGARRRVADVLEFWRPLPVPGSVAIFSPSGAPGAESVATTPVERVVLRQRVRRVPLDHAAPQPPDGDG